jgi:hypothetical protein
MKIMPDQLTVHNSSPKWRNIVARKGFPLSACRPLQQNHFAGPVLYYYEITAKSPLLYNERQVWYCFFFEQCHMSKIRIPLVPRSTLRKYGKLFQKYESNRRKI